MLRIFIKVTPKTQNSDILWNCWNVKTLIKSCDKACKTTLTYSVSNAQFCWHFLLKHAKLPNLRKLVSENDVKDTLLMGVTYLPRVLYLSFNILLLLEVTDSFDSEEKETFTLHSAFAVQCLNSACLRQSQRQLNP